MSFQIEKSVILPQQPDMDNPEDIRRFNLELIKFIDVFQNYLKKDLSMIDERLTALEP
jgi:hypothetical protein